MRRIPKVSAGLILVAALAAGPAARAGETVATPGTGPAYKELGKVAVMHEGRVKPLDTVAREEVKQVYGRETIVLPDSREAVENVLDPSAARKAGASDRKVEKWGHVGAFLGWTIRPEYWDDQPFVFVDYFPLRRLILAGTIESRLKGIADKAGTTSAEKDRLRSLAVDPEINAPDLIAFVRDSKLPEQDRRTIAELAVKLSEEHKWLSPRELQEASIRQPGGDGSQAGVPFLSWASAASDKKQQFDRHPRTSERPTEIERRGITVAQRFVTYQAYSGDRLTTAGVVLIMPRPSDAKYLAFTAEAIKDARARESADGMSPMRLDALGTVASYWNLVQPKDKKKLPTEDADIDAKFTEWLRGSSVWVPLKTFLKAKPDELVAAGYPEGAVKSFLEAYRELEQAEVRSPGAVDETIAGRFVSASRSLGESVSPQYPSVALIERETRFNAANPFLFAPFSYGTALVVLVLALVCLKAAPPASAFQAAGRGAYWLGLGALVGGIVLEIYGFYMRIRISGWAPVTNMYETVIWVALVSATLALIFDLVFRQVFVALAGSFVALLCTLTAASVPLLDPSIKSLQPVLRDNFWLGTHVLAVVSSYAAFALAWALGLLATLFYLTATYRRSPRLGEVVLPLIPALPLLTAGAAGVAAGYGMFGPAWTTGDSLFYVFSFMGLLGGMLTLASFLALGGELINRLIFRDAALEEDFAGDSEAVSTPLATSGRQASFDSSGGVATLVKPTVAEIRAREASARVKLDARGLAMQRTAAIVKPIANFVYRTMQVGVLLVAAGTILGGVWADYSWGRFWGWDAKEVWALATLIVYLIPLHGRFAGWVNTFWLVFASVFCFLSVIMAWYGVNFVIGVGLHSYGFTEGGSQGSMMIIIAGVLALPVAAAWRRHLGYRPVF